MRVEAIYVSAHPIPLREPFAISRASVSSTRAAVVRVLATAPSGSVEGLGEAALPLGAPESVDDLVASLRGATEALVGRELASLEAVARAADELLADRPTARCGLTSALCDALARAGGVPLYQLLGADGAVAMETDITLPIADPEHSAALARGYWREGFRCFKLKVGADAARDRRMVDALAAATPGAAVRFDANEGYDAVAALALLAHTRAAGLRAECFEQPCARADVAGMRRVRQEGGVPVVADEAVATLADLERMAEAQAVDGVNLKLVKMGGLDRCLTIGRRARALGLGLMVGAMIESRLGLTAMAHVVAALGGADWVDLDTAFLLAADPYAGGMVAQGPRLTLPSDPGLAMVLA